jgi:hypothetical protein
MCGGAPEGKPESWTPGKPVSAEAKVGMPRKWSRKSSLAVASDGGGVVRHERARRTNLVGTDSAEWT